MESSAFSPVSGVAFKNNLHLRPFAVSAPICPSYGHTTFFKRSLSDHAAARPRTFLDPNNIAGIKTHYLGELSLQSPRRCRSVCSGVEAQAKSSCHINQTEAPTAGLFKVDRMPRQALHYG